MFKPLDTLTFDMDWPVDNGKISGLRDIRVIVKAKPAGMAIPCGIAVTSVSANSLTVAMCTRGTHVVNDSTSLTIQKEASSQIGVTYRASNDYLVVDITTGFGNFSIESGTTPLLIVPCCVLWLIPSYDPFDSSVLPDPVENSGWSREIDRKSKRIVYKGAAPGSAVTGTTAPYSGIHLKCLDGISPVDLFIKTDRKGAFVTMDKTSADDALPEDAVYTLTIHPVMRDLSDEGRTL